MTPFQLYFSFFTLIIGLAVAAVARGFGTLWQSRRSTRVGYLTPLLAAFLLLDMSRFWLALWNRQEISSLGPTALASVLCVTLPYVFATTIMFPADPGEWESLDDYYLAHSRPIFLALLASKIAAYAFDALLFQWQPKLGDVPGIVLILAPFLLLIIFRSATVHRAGLILLVGWSGLVFVAAS
jgi:hypothetical protein